MILSLVVSQWLKSKFNKYSKTTIGLTGKEVAEKMLRDNDVLDVKVVSVNGMLTDHYDPRTKTVNLSEGVYSKNNIAAAAVAAHECGHAIQHATAYSFLQFRSAMVPVVSFASKWVQWVLLGGILLINIFPQLMLAGIVLFALTTLFSFVTLPVEIDASKRALAWLKTTNVATPETYPMAKDALKTAAYTYIIAALSSLATLLYYLSIFLRRN